MELLGYCADQHHRLLIFEFMPNGTLQQHLHTPNNRAQPLNWGTRLRIALDCARALEFLHEHTTPSVIHRDFKCSNILLDQNFRAKVSDFGLAKIGSDKINGQISTRVMGTTGYLAPELVFHYLLHLPFHNYPKLIYIYSFPPNLAEDIRLKVSQSHCHFPIVL